ncbi:MAG: urea carboxylase-associated family protein, partial [Thiovulaceae bacterium]|nr:urea carboxylase-associated family protein [Sulfurimonadaceae bacterium]
VELGKYGMGKRDMIPAINFFRKVDVKEGSNLELSSKRPKPGGYIELRAEMNVLLVLSNTPHVMEEGKYNPSDVQLTLYKAAPVTADDFCLNYSPQSQRAFINNAHYFA